MKQFRTLAVAALAVTAMTAVSPPIRQTRVRRPS